MLSPMALFGVNWHMFCVMPCADKIEFYDDYTPYSFIFREIRNGKPIVTGGLALHELEDIKKAHYSIHT